MEGDSCSLPAADNTQDVLSASGNKLTLLATQGELSAHEAILTTSQCFDSKHEGQTASSLGHEANLISHPQPNTSAMQSSGITVAHTCKDPH